MRVVFAGTPEFALPALKALLENHEVVGVLTQPDRASGRGRRLAASAVKNFARERQLRLLQPETLRDPATQAQLAALAPDAIVVVAYGLILPAAVLSLPRFGCLNIHASLLPRWRGAAPVQRAILAGDEITGVSIMRMEEGLDTGPVLLESRQPIGAGDTSGSLLATLAERGAALLLTALGGLAQGTMRAVPQPETGATYARKIDKAEARIDWSEDAASLDRKVRAFNPSPIAYTLLGADRVRIYSASIVSLKSDKSHETGSIIALDDRSLLVQSGNGTVLAVRELQIPGGKVLPVSGELLRNLERMGRRFD